MKYFVILLILVGISVLPAYAQYMGNVTDVQPPKSFPMEKHFPPLEIGRNVTTYLFDYEKTPIEFHCGIIPQYSYGQFNHDVIYPDENFDEEMGKFLLERTVTSNSNELHLKMELLDKQNKPIPHVGFLLNVTKQDEVIFTKLFHTHSGLLNVVLNQSNSVSQWGSDGKLESYLGGLESTNDHFIINTPMLPQDVYRFDVIVLSAYYDKNIFVPQCTPKFGWSLLINEYDSAEIITDSKVVQNSKINYNSPLKQFKAGVKFHNVECNEGLVLAQRGNSERSVCVTLDTKIELTVRGWADDDRVILGCIGERVQKCYPEDKNEYRTKLQNYYYGFTEEPDSKIDVSCMPMEASKSTAIFFKIPSYLPEGYSFKCSFSGTPYESYLIFDNKKVPDRWISHYPELVSNGAVFIYQTDEKSAVGEEKYATYGTPTQRIQETYDDVMTKNPSLHPQLIQINGMLAFAVDSCNNCGVQTANFTDGIIQKYTSSESKIKFIDENGTSYLLKAGIPLSELIKVAESLQ